MIQQPKPQISPDDLPHFPFTPVPLDRVRNNGWTEAQQRRFITALGVTGSVSAAVRAIGISRHSAYRLRERPGADSFARAWDDALDFGRMTMFSYAMDRAINGVTIVRVLKGGSIRVTGGPDMQLVQAAIREERPVPQRQR